VESRNGLRTIVHEGASLPLTAGSAGKVFMTWASAEDRQRLLASAEKLTPETPVDPARLEQDFEAIRAQGWAESVGERELGVASVSAPVRDARGGILAAVSVSGPIERTGSAPGDRYATEVIAAARAIERSLGVDTQAAAG
jgi:DNA-binding IclR family transcriptional regulator